MMTHTLTISNSLHSLISLQNLSLCVLGLKPHLNAPLKGTLAWKTSTFYACFNPFPFRLFLSSLLYLCLCPSIYTSPFSCLKKLIMKEINKNIDYYYYTMSPTGLPTWSPTTEQVMILEELYRNGIRTTSASTKLE